MQLLFSFIRALRVALMLLLLGLVILLYIILETPYGLRLVNTFLPLLFPFTVKVDAPHGALLDTLYADKIVYRDDNVDVEVINPAIHLNFFHLFSGEIKIDHITADNVRVLLLDNGAPSTLTRAKLLQNLTLPFSLNLNNGSFKHLIVAEAHQQPWVDLQVAEISALMNSEPHFTLRAQWQQGNIALIPKLPLHSINGQLSIDGKLPDYAVHFDARLQNGDADEKTTHVEGQGDFSGLRLTQVNLSQNKDAVSAPMQVTWLPHFQWNIPKLTGKIHNYPVNGHIALRKDGHHWQIDDSEITIHDASLKVISDTKTEELFYFKLAIPEIETLITHSQGHILAEGTWTNLSQKPEINAFVNAGGIVVNDTFNIKNLQGKFKATSIYPIVNNIYWTQFQITTDATLQQIHLNHHDIENGTLHFDGAIDGQHSAILHLDAKNLQVHQVQLQSLSLDAENKNASQTAKLNLNWGKKTLSATLTGHYQNEMWHGALETLLTNFNVRLQKKSLVTITSNQLHVDSTCFNIDRSSLCANFDFEKNKSFKATVNGQQIPINTLSQFFTPNIKAEGTLSLSANILGDGHSIQNGDVHLALSDGKLIKTDVDRDTLRRLPFRASRIDINLSSIGLSVDGNLNILQQPPIRLQLSAPKLHLNDPNWSNTPLQGQLQFSTRQLEPLSALYPQFKNIKGLLSAEIAVKGTINSPQLLGNVQFKEGQLDVPSLGLHLTPIEFSAVAQNNRILYTGRINTNPGILNLQGYSDLTPDKRKSEFLISGDTLTAMRTTEYQVSASPQLRLTWLNQILTVEGQITIPKAQISPIDLGDTVTLSDDVVFVNGQKTKRKTRLPIRTHVKIILGDAIYLKVKGLTARLIGSVDIKEDENSTQTTGIGQINVIDGRYKSHGENLTLRTGRAIFTGSSVTNPGLYIEAVRTVSTYVTANAAQIAGQKNTPQVSGALQSDLIVGARITGTVDVPQITFFSEPGGLTQSQILSYLVLGKSQSSGSDLDTGLLLKAVSFLDIGGEETAATRNSLQKDLGLDEIGVQSQQEYSAESQSLVNNTSLVLGKALSPKLFVDYSIGLIEPINILHIRYQLSKHFTLRSESTMNAQGIDVFYNMER